MPFNTFAKKTGLSEKLFAGILIGAAVVLLISQISYTFINRAPSAGKGEASAVKKASKTTADTDKMVQDAIKEVTPAQGFTTNVKWNGVVSKMIKQGALDPVKLASLLKQRYGQDIKPEWREVLDGKNTNLEINSDNAVFMMYLLWTIAKDNNNQILVDSPFANSFTNYDIGVGASGYGGADLLSLSPEQQQIAKEVAENANRPCCNNSTAWPDCSHGFAALGLVELMASQDFNKAEIFDTFVKFNSFWFPQTYVNNALYFKLAQGKNWSQVDKEVVAGKDYSSLSGASKVKNYLKTNFGL
jgi:hypothetical protein